MVPPWILICGGGGSEVEYASGGGEFQQQGEDVEWLPSARFDFAQSKALLVV